jgi:hypothetical protein
MCCGEYFSFFLAPFPRFESTSPEPTGCACITSRVHILPGMALNPIPHCLGLHPWFKSASLESPGDARIGSGAHPHLGTAPTQCCIARVSTFGSSPRCLNPPAVLAKAGSGTTLIPSDAPRRVGSGRPQHLVTPYRAQQHDILPQTRSDSLLRVDLMPLCSGLQH